MGLINDLGRGPVGVDTAIFIYFIEEHPTFLPLIEPLFQEVDDGRRELVTSALTLLEVLVVPYRSGDHPSGVSLKAANWGQIKTGQRKGPGTVRSCTRSRSPLAR